VCVWVGGCVGGWVGGGGGGVGGGGYFFFWHQWGGGGGGDNAVKRGWVLEVAGRKGAHLQLLALVRNGQV